MTAIAPPPVGTETDPAAQNDNAAAVESLAHAPLATRTRASSAAALLAFGAVTLLGGALSGFVNRKRRNKAWYRLLAKPSFTPPDRAFAVVWPVLYAGAAASGWRVWRTAPSPERSRALALWGTQMAFNFAWSPIFFGAHRPRLALADLAANAGSLGAYARAASRVDRPASALVLPYLGWLGFAALMNGGIVARNRGFVGRRLARG